MTASHRDNSIIRKCAALWHGEDTKKIARDSSWLFSRNLITTAIALLQNIAIARWLRVENYGVLALVFTYVEIVNQIVDFRVYEAATKYISEFWVNERKGECLASIKLFFFIDTLSGIIAFSVVSLTADFSATHIIHRPEISGLITIYMWSLLFNTANGTSTAILGVFNKFNWISLHAIGVAFLRFTLVVIALLVKPDVKNVIIAYVISDLLGGFSIVFLSLIIVRGNLWSFRRSSNIRLLKDRCKELRIFLLNTNANELLTLVTKNIDILFLGYFRTPLEVGYYRMAKLLVGTVSLISEPFYTIIYPAFAKMWVRKEFERIRDTILKITFSLGTVLLFYAVVIALCAPFIIRLFVGIEFLPATIAVRIMIWGYVVGGIFVWVRPLLLAAGKPNIPTLVNLVCAIAIIVFSLLVVSAYGYVGSALVFLLPWFVGHVIIIGYIFRMRILRGQPG